MSKVGSNVVAPFERVKDVNVIMTLLHPQPLVGLGNLLLVNKVDKPATLKTVTGFFVNESVFDYNFIPSVTTILCVVVLTAAGVTIFVT